MKTVTQQRKLDSVYDTTFTVSDRRDLYRDVQRNNPAKIEKVPNYQNMFSDSSLHPSHSYRIMPEKFVPKPPPAQPPVNYFTPTTYLQSGKNTEVDVSASRYMFFNRPQVGQTQMAS